jgi:hypothetical protein
MNSIAETRKPLQEDLRYYLPRWIAVFVVITLTQELVMSPSKPQGLWTIPSLVLIGLLEGAIGGLLFVGLQRWWNPRDSRVVRIRNYVAALMIVGVGSLFAMTAIYR